MLRDDPDNVALGVDDFAFVISLCCLEIDRPVAYRAVEYCWIGTRHTSPSWDFLRREQPWRYFKKGNTRIQQKMWEGLSLAPASSPTQPLRDFGMAEARAVNDSLVKRRMF